MVEARDRKTAWYVIQVRTGMEDAMCRRIERMCLEHDETAESRRACVGLRECFSPRRMGQRKWKGEWQDVEYPLLPGYVIVDAENPDRLAEAIRGMRDMCKMLSDGETYMPLDEGERLWIERQTDKDSRIIPMSFAHRIGDELEIIDGPLSGYSGQITQIDRSKSVAYLEFHIGQMTIKTKVGLAILPNEKH